MPACLEAITPIYDRLGVALRPRARRELLQPDAARRGRRPAGEGDRAARARGRSSSSNAKPPPEDGAEHRADAVIRKRDGAFTYTTTDLATIKYRIETWQPDAMLYVVGLPPGAALQDALRAAPAAGATTASSCEHIASARCSARTARSAQTRKGGAAELSDAARRGRRARAGEVRAELRASGSERGRGRAGADGRGDAGDRRGGRHRGGQVRRPEPEPDQRLRVRLGQDARDGRQHGDVHAVRLRPLPQHLPQGRAWTTGGSGPTRRRCSSTHPAERALALQLLRFEETLDARGGGVPAAPASPPTCGTWRRATAVLRELPGAQGRDAGAAGQPAAAVRPDGAGHPARRSTCSASGRSSGCRVAAHPRSGGPPWGSRQDDRRHSTTPPPGRTGRPPSAPG